MSPDELKRLRALCEKIEFDCQDNSCRFARKKGGMRTNGGCRCDNGVLFMSTMSSVWKALPQALDEIDRLRKINDEAVRLLHMLDRPEARHPDVALFLDGLDPDAGPE